MIDESLDLDWDRAEEHLKEIESAYTSIGRPGYLALNFVIRPVRDRFNAGDRNDALWHEIMNLE
jgi:hypothetical protein